MIKAADYSGSSEAEMRRILFTPFLVNVAHCASSMVLTDSTNVHVGAEMEYASYFPVEVTSEGRPYTRGRNPQVDYLISGFIDDEPLCVIPVEGKKKITIKHMPQISHYVATMVNGKLRLPQRACLWMVCKHVLHCLCFQ